MSSQKGFTLLETLVVITIVAILALVAIPGYQQPTQVVLRTQAGACLMQIAGQLARHQLQTKNEENYSLRQAAPPCVDQLSEQFQFGFMNAEGDLTSVAPSQGGWRLQAKLRRSGQTSTQRDCVGLIYDHTGARAVVGSDGVTYSHAQILRDCW